jgi:hypothetical protein
MKKITVMKIFTQECVILVDQGKMISIQEVKDRIEEDNLVNWLKDEYMTDKSFYIGTNSFSDKDIEFVNREYNNMLLGYYDDEFRKWGIKNNGLNLLISWGIELIRDIDKMESI